MITAPAMHLLPAPAGINHGGGLLALGGPNLLVCWYSGRTEAGRDAVILCSRSGDGGETWPAPVAVSTPQQRALGAAEAAKSVGNVALVRDGAGRLMMISGEVQSRKVLGLETCRNWRCGRTDFRISTDEGRTWSSPTRLDDDIGALPRSRPIHVDGLGDLIPLYRERRGSVVFRLDLASLAVGRPVVAERQVIPAPVRLLQPSLTVSGAGELLAVLRDPARRYVYVSRYDRATGAWSRAEPSNLANPSSAVELFTDARGRVVLVYNPDHHSREVLSLAFFAGGRRFVRGCDLTDGGAGDSAYPSVARIGPSAWGLAFSVEGKRRMAFMRLDQDFLDACAAAAAATP